ncbi:Mu transposase C-terminal domain-containing protein [Rugamonas sp.]|uniref:Mu transposase C-terminal domain-containing protein n=1 Tax=Rugamonas sp. TaxID=1926287 RepID=UPI0025DA8705|nr:Mu transposase C-terminal domain-containing protein [Rugamonas sp.]
MLLRNDLLQYTDPQPRIVRILWIDPERGGAYIFDVDAVAADAEPVPLQTLLDDLQAGKARLLLHDPYLVLVSQELLPQKHLQLRERAWAIVQGLTAQEPGIYEPRRRGQLVAECIKLHGVSHPTIYRYLRRYWQRGQTPNALLPDYGNSGAPGKVRGASADVKRGRPRKDGAEPGLNVDQEIRKTFRVAAARYAAMHEKFSRRGAYDQMIRDFFCLRHVEPETGRVVHALPQTVNPQTAALPTFGQFNYWLEQDSDRPATVSQRALGVRNGGHGGAAGDGGAAAMPAPLQAGRPGTAFYLDAVRADVQLVSRADRAQVVGRPLLYVVTDVFSGMIAGLYVSLEPPGWPHALQALAHAGACKLRYCQSFGRAIEEQDWPSHHLPAALVVHPALAEGWRGDVLLNNFNIGAELREHGPAEWQAVLAKRFTLLPPEHGGRGSQLDGVLDVAQFTRIVIECALYYNRHHTLREAGATPLELWNWGADHRGVALKTYPEQLLRCCLLPVAQACVTADGIRLHDSYYTCARAIDERWFERARQRGQWHVKVAFDAANLDTVYLLDASTSMQFHACHLTDRSDGHRHLSAVEIALHQQARQRTRAQAGVQAAAGLAFNIEQIVAGAAG